MSDLISRQAAIDEIKAVYEWHDVVTEDRMIQHFKVLPSVQEQRWIPVTERLPEEDGVYIVTYKIPHEGKDIESFGVGVKHFIGRLKMWSMNDLSTPIAWMPLPEPYKGEK